jgi:hypothetical protein
VQQGAQLRVSKPLPVDALPPSANLLSVSNRFGWLACGVLTEQGSALFLAQLEDVRSALAQAERSSVHELPPRHLVRLDSEPCFVRFAATDVFVLVALKSGSVLFFRTQDIASGKTVRSVRSVWR